MREVALLIYGGVIGWYLCELYQRKKEQLMWEIDHQARAAVMRARAEEAFYKDPPAASETPAAE